MQRNMYSVMMQAKGKQVGLNCSYNKSEVEKKFEHIWNDTLL